MTREHRAWEMLIRRLDYLNGFGGNRSEMEKTTRIVAQIWDDAGCIHAESNDLEMKAVGSSKQEAIDAWNRRT